MSKMNEDSDEDIDVPKVLGDIFESVAGAIFLDSGMSFDAVWSIIHPLMINEISNSIVREIIDKANLFF